MTVEFLDIATTQHFLFLISKPVFEHLTGGDAMPTPQTGQKGSAGLLQCPRILLTCFRVRISGGHPTELRASAVQGDPSGQRLYFVVYDLWVLPCCLHDRSPCISCNATTQDLIRKWRISTPAGQNHLNISIYIKGTRITLEAVPILRGRSVCSHPERDTSRVPFREIIVSHDTIISRWFRLCGKKLNF